MFSIWVKCGKGPVVLPSLFRTNQIRPGTWCFAVSLQEMIKGDPETWGQEVFLLGRQECRSFALPGVGALF